MVLPEHSCISCASLCGQTDSFITIVDRNLIVKKDPHGTAKLIYLVCNQGKLPQFYTTGIETNEIFNRVTKPNKCKKWKRFIGISAMATEQKESTKWARWAFWAVIGSIIVAVIVAVLTFVISQFILD